MQTENKNLELENCLVLLEQLCQQPELCLAPDSPYAELVAKISLLQRRLKATRKKENRLRDHELAENTGIRKMRTEKEHGTYLNQDHSTQATDVRSEELDRPRKCYICKQSFGHLHHFYDSLCPGCAQVNWDKRNQTADLQGRTALVTGGRIKIGFQIALKLLRAGANVVVTSRFPRDTAKRYQRESDFADWHDRLKIYSADFRFLPAVAEMAQQIQSNHDLNILINNAAQTVRRPPEYYEHLLTSELQLENQLPATALKMIESAAKVAPAVATTSQSDITTVLTTNKGPIVPNAPLHIAPLMSQLRLVESDGRHGQELFPTGQLDYDGQQIDKRPVNSWVMDLDDVSFAELLEVHAVNSLAGYTLIKHLLPTLSSDSHDDRYIVNVSAVEGQFDASKTGFHPHTNMAKAGMNMVTKTCGQRFAQRGIYITSVDTGWVTNEFPFQKTQQMRTAGFEPPLDEIDGAARVLAPVFEGVADGKRLQGVFLKDYQVANW